MQSFENFLKSEKQKADPIREAYVREQYDMLLEKLITFGGKAYPKFGNIVIMAGGAGSGKGFVKDKLVGLEGRTFDVDELKTLAAKTPFIQRRVKAEFGVDLGNLAKDLKNPENVAKLHEIIGDALKLPDKRMQAFYASVLTAADDRKPNIIFDVTLKDLRKLQNITRQVSNIGYDRKNVHIVWVVNDIEIAKKQNTQRDRMVPVEILVNTHRGASQTMLDITNMGTSLKKYMDGDIVFAFNKIGVDSDISTSGKGGMTVTDANYFYVKRAGQPVTSSDRLSKELKAKVASYVPKNIDWV